jgi:hypothetical protein
VKILAFDLETAKPAGDDYPGITCGAAVGVPRIEAVFTGDVGDDGRYGLADPDEIVEWLYRVWKDGYMVWTWNGVGADFRWLHQGCSDSVKPLVAELALEHFDPMFHMLCSKGYVKGLDDIAKGLGLAGKTEGMDGLQAVEMWGQGRGAQEKVLEYVREDALLTMNVAGRHMMYNEFAWTARSGKPYTWQTVVMSVRECLTYNLPDTGWMSRRPWTRRKFAGWLADYVYVDEFVDYEEALLEKKWPRKDDDV